MTVLKYIIGADIGTGSAKAIAMDTTGKIITEAQFFYPTLSLQEEYVEQDPEIIWQAFTQCIRTIKDELNFCPLSISLSSAMHSLLAVDCNGMPLSNLITWADTRSEKIADRLRHLPIAKELYETSGTPIHSMTPLCKLMWLQENNPSLVEKTFKFISIKEFIWYQLFHLFEIDESIASATGLFNIQTRTWNDISLGLCGLKSDQLSEVVPTHFMRENLHPEATKQLGIFSNTPFCIGASDGCLANIGSYAIEPGVAALTIGTSGAVRIAHSTPIIDFKSMGFNYILDEATFICGGPVNNGGNIIGWLFKSFLNIDQPTDSDYEDLFTRVATVPSGSKGLLLLPYVYGERAPIWDERSSGVFFGMKPYHQQAYFLRAALEGICFSLKSVLEIMEQSQQSQGEIKQLNVSGGFIHSAVWMQILADITGKRVVAIESQDASSIGAALLGMKTLGLISSYGSLQPKNLHLIEPNYENHSLYLKNYSIFQSLYEPLKEAMHASYEINRIK